MSVQVHASINAFLKLLLKTAIEIFKECRATRQYNVIVKLNAVSHRTSLDRIIDNLFNGLLPVLVNKFRMEEHFRAKEAFIADIDINHVVIHGLVNELLEFG